MTLREALETGRPLKRKRDLVYNPRSNNFVYTFSIQQVLADDWEVEEILTLTRAQIQQAIRDTSTGPLFVTNFLKNLGFKDV